MHMVLFFLLSRKFTLIWDAWRAFRSERVLLAQVGRKKIAILSKFVFPPLSWQLHQLCASDDLFWMFFCCEDLGRKTERRLRCGGSSQGSGPVESLLQGLVVHFSLSRKCMIGNCMKMQCRLIVVLEFQESKTILGYCRLLQVCRSPFIQWIQNSWAAELSTAWAAPLCARCTLAGDTVFGNIFWCLDGLRVSTSTAHAAQCITWQLRLLREGEKLRLLCANCGDSRAVLCRNRAALPLSKEPLLLERYFGFTHRKGWLLVHWIFTILCHGLPKNHLQRPIIVAQIRGT